MSSQQDEASAPEGQEGAGARQEGTGVAPMTDAAGQPAPQPRDPLAGRRLPWKTGDDGRTVFRRVTPFVIWWIWVVFAIFNLIQVVIPDHDYFSLEFTAGLL